MAIALHRTYAARPLNTMTSRKRLERRGREEGREREEKRTRFPSPHSHVSCSNSAARQDEKTTPQGKPWSCKSERGVAAAAFLVWMRVARRASKRVGCMVDGETADRGRGEVFVLKGAVWSCNGRDDAVGWGLM
jgi:hypothetical protein